MTGDLNWPRRMYVRSPDEDDSKPVSELFDSSEQVIHDTNQVTSPDQLRVGQVHEFRTSDLAFPNGQLDSPGGVLEIDSPEKGWIKAKHFDPDGETRIRDHLMADRGIIPYGSGSWNPFNYMVLASEEALERLRGLPRYEEFADLAGMVEE